MAGSCSVFAEQVKPERESCSLNLRGDSRINCVFFIFLILITFSFHFERLGSRKEVPYLWLRVGFPKQGFQAQFSVTKSGTLREGYAIPKEGKMTPVRLVIASVLLSFSS